MSHGKASTFGRYSGLAVLLAVLSLPGSLWAADPKIDLYVEGSEGNYKLRFLNSECPGEPNRLGCIKVAKGSKNWLQWEMDKDDWKDGWDFHALKLSWDDPSLTNCIVADFNVDPNTGYANDFQVRGNGKFGRNRDENDCERPYEVNYRIYARNRETGEEANSDPIIKNGGRN